MRGTRAARGAVLILAALSLSGCSFLGNALWPPAKPAPEKASAAPAPAPIAPADSAPMLGTGQFTVEPAGPIQPTGTVVGARVQTLWSDMQGLQSRIGGLNGRLQSIRGKTRTDTEQYHGTVAAISARLQFGTTPGNPILVNQWNEAQNELSEVSGDVTAMNQLSLDVAGAASEAAFLLDSARAAYNLSGGIDEDRRHIETLEDHVNRLSVTIDRLLTELSGDISRQTAYVASERGNLTTLNLAIKNGELYGASLANRGFMPGSDSLAAGAASYGGAYGGTSYGSAYGAPYGTSSSPLVVIRFDRPDIRYEQALYSALGQAVERRPTALFDVVAVAPSAGNSAQVALGQMNSRRRADEVVRKMVEMGLQPDRIRLSATTSPDVYTNEVQIYAR